MKNKYLLTVSVSSILLLTACGDTWSSLTGNHTEQSISGGRRTPSLNKSISAPNKEASTTENIPPSEQAKPAKVSDSNPYDKYDADGNEVKSSEDKGNFFSNLVGWNEPNKPDKTTLVEENLAVAEATKPSTQNVMRKPLQGNLPYQSQKPATITPEVQVGTANKEDFFSKTSSLQEAPKEASKEVVQDKPTESKSNESLLGQIGSKLKFSNDEKANSDVKVTYPSVSSVPEKPEEFKAVSEEKKQNFDSLKTEHEAAQQEKQALDNEVAGVTTPLLSKTAQTSTSIETKTKDKVETKLESISPEEKAKRDADVIAPEYSSESISLPPAITSEDEIKNATTKQEEKKEEKQPDQASTPSSDSSVSYLPPNEGITKDAIPQDAATQSVSGFEPASNLIGNSDGTESTLPSPEKIKTLRPSRYETRRRASSSY